APTVAASAPFSASTQASTITRRVRSRPPMIRTAVRAVARPYLRMPWPTIAADYGALIPSVGMTTYGYASQKPAIVRRLHRIEGQVRGIEKMVDDDRYCIDILTQISAATTALESLALQILDDHIRHCVAGAIA